MRVCCSLYQAVALQVSQFKVWCLQGVVHDDVRLAQPALSCCYDKGDLQLARNVAAEYIRGHSDDFLPFMVNDKGDMLDAGETVAMDY